jgi:hypothetical protein
LIGFTPHAVGISEDTWAVAQAAHNVMALGGRVRFGLSRAFWHKMRETWSHAEWLASFPRWSGGYLQMMSDPLMQRVNDFGPFSVFAREMRAHSGRSFLTAPFALLNILLLPVAILAGVTPFVQILIVLWNFGFVMNQVLTLHGLNVYLESAGFRRGLALAGAAVGGGLAWSQPSLHPVAGAVALLGGLYGGFFEGFHRWLYTRVRDAVMFGPQLVLHTLGQVVRQTIEFVASGASATDPEGVNMPYRASGGPREDQPQARYPHCINLRTVVWVVGGPSLLFVLLALSKLDMFNVLLLLPSLLFTVSVLCGPFLCQPRPGRHLGSRVLLPRVAGWLGAFAFFGLVSLLVARGGLGDLLGPALVLGMAGLGVRHGGRYLFYHRRLILARQTLGQLLHQGGLALDAAGRLARELCAQAGDAGRVKSALSGAGLDPALQAAAQAWVEGQVAPLLAEPMRFVKRTSPCRSRGCSELGRSFVFALMVLVWFVVVPVPGLFVLSVGPYHTSLLLEHIIAATVVLLALAITGYWTAAIIQQLGLNVRWPWALRNRSQRAFRILQHRTASATLDAESVARLHAFATDFQTYIDQRSPAYARRVLCQLEAGLSGAREP